MSDDEVGSILDEEVVSIGLHCPCRGCRQLRRDRLMGMGVSRSASARAQALLLEHLTPEQAADWKANQAFNVRGSNGRLWRVAPGHAGRHTSMVREDGTGTAVWPVDLLLRADWALAMLLHLTAHEYRVYESGCHARLTYPSVPTGNDAFLPTDYGGKL